MPYEPDWNCPGCGDLQFARNSSCRQCGTPKPAGMGMPGMGNATLNLDAVIPASPQEVEQFLMLNPVEEKAAVQFRSMDPRAQRLCINKGSLAGARDSTAAFIGRMASVKRIVNSGMSGGAQAMQAQGGGSQWQCPACGNANFAQAQQCSMCGCPNVGGAMMGGGMMGGGMMGGGMMVGGMMGGGGSSPMDQINPASPQEVEQFLMMNPVEGKAQDQFRNMDPRAQRLVLNKGSLEGARDPTAAFIGRLVKIDQMFKSQHAQNDWICPSCGDQQFGRNLQCRMCSTPRPAGGGAGGGMGMMSFGDMGGGGGGYGAMRGGGINRASPYGQQAMGMAQMGFGGGNELAGVTPATPVEVEEFLILNPVEEKAATQFRNMDPRGQQIVLQRGSLEGSRDNTAAFIGRMVKVERMLQGGMLQGGGMGAAQSLTAKTVAAAPEEVEQFLILNPVEAHAQQKFRGLDPKIQRIVINRGSLEGARDATAAFIGRMVEIERIARGQVQLPPGDWMCAQCGDHQFMRNETCRKCGAPKP